MIMLERDNKNDILECEQQLYLMSTRLEHVASERYESDTNKRAHFTHRLTNYSEEHRINNYNN